VSFTPSLHTPRLDLEPVRPSHAEEAWPQLDDERIWRYFPALRPASVDDLRRQYEKWARGSQRANEVWHNWLCRDRASGILVGSMQATVFPKSGASYVAYAMFPANQRKGYAREAARAVIDYVKAAYGVQRFFAEMDTRNEPSYRLAESLGFVRVETRLATERGHGIDADEYLYELNV
jgi:RimJ/RimL family protein N-acetyltransferase